MSNKEKRRQKLLSFLKKFYKDEKEEEIEMEWIEELGRSIPKELWETHGNYQYSHWTDELEEGKYYLRDALHEAEINKCYDADGHYIEGSMEPVNGGLDLKVNDYIKELEQKECDEEDRYAELCQRDLAIREWFEDHGIDPTVDPDIKNRDAYIWWYTKNENGDPSFNETEKKKRADIKTQLDSINPRKKELENSLRPWKT